MRLLLTLSLTLLFHAVYAQTDSFLLQDQTMYVHRIKGGQLQKKLMIFLHGSVKAYRDREPYGIVPVSELLEGNNDLIPACLEQGYDLLIPLAYKEWNWLEPGGQVYLDSLMQRYGGQYESVVLAGFSDGGTGAYRYFYSNLQRYAGLWVMNGYPQWQNFYRKVSYQANRIKPVVWYAQDEDKVVPHEFLLTEYRRQRIVNANTIFRLLPGKHELIRYRKQELIDALELLQHPVANEVVAKDSIWIYPPADGYMKGDNMLAAYHFRASAVKKYGMQAREYKDQNLPGCKAPEKLHISPVKIAFSDLGKDEFTFPGSCNGSPLSITLPNYLSFNAW